MYLDTSIQESLLLNFYRVPFSVLHIYISAKVVSLWPRLRREWFAGRPVPSIRLLRR